MRRIQILALLVLAFLPPTAVQAQTTVVVVQEGDASPDGNGTFSAFSNPALNDVGQVVYGARLSGTSGGTTDDRGIFRGNGATAPVQIAREGQAAPDGNGTFSDFFLLPPSFNNVGQAAFNATLTETSGGSSDSLGIFLGDGVTEMSQIARAGQAAPEDNYNFSYFSRFPALNDSGQTAFYAGLATASGGFGYFRGEEVNGPTTIIRPGQSSPAGDGTFLGYHPTAGTLFLPALNGVGQVAFGARFFADSGGINGGSGGYLSILRSDGENGLTYIARTGNAAPDGNGTFSDFENPALNDSGQAAFLTRLTGTNGGSSDAHGIFLSDGATGTTQIVRTGQVAPDGNGTFASLADPVLNNAGQAAFLARLTGSNGGLSNNGGIFWGDGLTGLTQIVRTGQTVPVGVGAFATIEDLALNDAGQVAFFARLASGDGGRRPDAGIFFQDDALGLLEVARNGDDLLGSTITDLRFQDGLTSNGNERSGLNELGQVAYYFELADGNSGIAIWTAPVPEPSTLVLSLAAISLPLRRRQ